LDGTSGSMKLGGGEERQGDQEPEQEKGNSEGTENSAWAGMNQFAPIAQDWNEDYNTGGWSDAAWGYGGFYALNKVQEPKHTCEGNCECGFSKVEGKRGEKVRIRENAYKGNQIPGGVFTVGNANEFEWMEIDAILDSGAVDTIAPKDMAKGNKIRQTHISKRNGKYAPADGGIIQNIGECEIEGVAHDGTEVKLVTQVGDKLTNMLIAVRRVVESGDMVVFGANMKAIRKLAACEKLGKNMIVDRHGRRTEVPTRAECTYTK
jgi:hypothetical protein